MIFVAPSTPPAIVWRPSDRAQGDAAMLLRESIDAVLASRDCEDRGLDIYRLIASALERTSVEGGPSPAPGAVGRAMDLLTVLPPAIPLPEVVIESESEIGLDWDEGKQRVVSLTVRESPMVGYSALLGAEPSYGRVEFADGFPPTLRFVLNRLYPHHARR